MRIGIFKDRKLHSTYDGPLDLSSANRSYLLCPPFVEHVEIPETFDHDCLKIEYVEEQVTRDLISEAKFYPSIPNRWYKDGVGFVEVDPNDETYDFIKGSEEKTIPAVYSENIVIPAHWVVIEDTELLNQRVALQKLEQKIKLKEQMEIDVLSEMTRVFGTSNMNSASANKDTWQLMIDEPSLFVGHMGFTTESEVIAFGTAKMSEVKGYAVYRAIRIEQFKNEVALL